MNFTILTQYYPPEIGAPQARLSELARRIADRGNKVSILTAMPNYPTGRIYPGYGGLITREDKQGITLIRTAIYPTQTARFALRMLNYMSFVASSAVFGSALLPPTDYLLVESPPLFLGLSAIWLSVIRRARLIFNVSDLWPESAVQLGIVQTGTLSHRLASSLEALCYKRAWLVTGQSRTILQDIEQRFPSVKTYHLSNGADTSRFHPQLYSQEIRSTLSQPEKLIVLYAGLHGLAQGLDQILDAANAQSSDSTLQFVFIGDGPEKVQLMQKADELKLANVKFLPPLPSSDIPPYVASADIIMVTLKKYIPGAVPSKIYEAMASSRPVILVADGEAAAIIRDNDAGIVVRPGDTAGLVEALRYLQNDPELRTRLGTNGRHAAEKYFNRDLIASQFSEYLESRL